MAKLQDKKPILIAVIIMIAAQMGTNFYLVAMPIVAAYFKQPTTVILDTVYYYLIPYGICQVLFAPFVNRIGFKLSSQIGFGIFASGGVTILLSTNISTFIAGRVIQGIGGAIIYVIIRMIIQKNYKETETNIAFSIIESFAMATPVVAPVVGAYLISFFSWQSLFYVILAYTLFAFICATKVLNSERASYAPKLSFIANNYFNLIKNFAYSRFLLVILFIFASTYLSLFLLPFVLSKDFGLSPKQYSLFMSLTIFASLSGTLASKFANERNLKTKLIKIATFILIFAGFAIKLIDHSLFAFISSIMAVFFSFGVIFPNAMADSFKQVPNKTGSEVALIGLFQVTGGAVLNFTVTRFFQRPEDALFIIFIISGVAILLLYRVPAQNSMKEPLLNSLKILFSSKKLKKKSEKSN